MQAAITASERGHEVTLCEKSESLGGMLKFADYDSLKHDLKRFKDYLIRRVNGLDIKVLTGTEADDKLIASLKPDAIIVATGSVPIVPEGIDGHETAYHASEVYYRPEILKGDRVVIIGGGLVGIETGIHLANLGKKVSVLEMTGSPAADAGMVYSIGVLAKAEELGVEIITGAEAGKIINNAVIYRKDGGEAAEGDVILCRRTEAMTGLILSFTTRHRLQPGQDCKKPGRSAGRPLRLFAAIDISML